MASREIGSQCANRFALAFLQEHQIDDPYVR
jgi:hypothetical protein